MSNAHATHTAILRDGLAVAVVHSSEVLGWFNRNTSMSMDWMVENEGYAIVTDAQRVRGWMAFDLFAGRRGYGVAGSLARLAREIETLVTAFEGNEHAAGEWRDYVAAPEIARMLRAFEGLLSYTDQGNNFDAIRGELSAWAHATAARVGEDLDQY